MKYFLLLTLSLFSCLILQAQCGETGDICYLDMDQAGMHLITFCPDNANEVLEMTMSFELIAEDSLYVYQGSDTSGPLLASYHGAFTVTGGTTFYGVGTYSDEVVSSGIAGECITLDFVSDQFESCAFGLPIVDGISIGAAPLLYALSCVCEEPIVDFTMSDDHICSSANTTIDFDASASMVQGGGSIVEYIWDFGDGTIGTGVTTSHTYEYSAELAEGWGNDYGYVLWDSGYGYVVSLTIIDDVGCQSSMYEIVFVSLPVENFFISGLTPEIICSGLDFSIVALTSTINIDVSVSEDVFWQLNGIEAGTPIGGGATTFPPFTDPGVYELVPMYINALGCQYCLPAYLVTITDSLDCMVESVVPDCPNLGFGNYVNLDMKVFIEGAYNTSSENPLSEMETDLNTLIPNEQPFNIAPYNYTGEETINISTENVVDWVLVEIREGTPGLTSQNTTVTAIQAALLLGNGDIVNAQNGELLRFSNLAPNTDYHVCIRHRNHLDILSAESFTPNVGPNTAYFDFTQAATTVWGAEQLKELETGVYGMYAGDFNGEGVIQTTDYDKWALSPSILNTYTNTDANLDGVVQTTDYDLWFLNIAKLASPEVIYD